MVFTEVAPWLEAVRAHNRETGHEILRDDDPMRMTLGFVCAECPSAPNEPTIWEIPLADVPRTCPPDVALVRTSDRVALTESLNEHTRDRFFENGPGPAALIPIEQIEPDAADMAWAVDHINQPPPPRR